VSFDREPVPSIQRVNPHVVSEVRRYVDVLPANIEGGRSLWLQGDPGTGKTTLAMLVSTHAISAGFTVAIYSLPRLLALLRESFGEGSRYSLLGLLDRLAAVDLLHIDDVGAEQTSPWVLEQLYTVINTRYEDGRSLLLTTNVADNALEEQIGYRTVSRIVEMCGDPLPLYGHDRRKDSGIVYPEPPHGSEANLVYGEQAPVPMAFRRLID